MPNRPNLVDSELSKLVTELGQLDARREALIRRIGQAIDAMAGSSRHEGKASSVRRGRGGRPKGYRVSAATRAKLRAAWKRRKALAGA